MVDQSNAINSSTVNGPVVQADRIDAGRIGSFPGDTEVFHVLGLGLPV
ncbi:MULTISPECIES: hypothetical protein [unclassified Kitasatospora]